MSKKAEYYKQCVLITGGTNTVSWIDEEFAVEGKKLKMQNDDKTWDERVWIVKSVGARQKKEILDAQALAYRKFFKEGSIADQMEDK